MIYRLGNIEIDPANFVLTKDGETVSVEPLVFDLITYLIENRDRMLTRQELFDEIWAGKIVSDASLSNHIKSARKALGDDGHQQRIIKTVHGRGYRFVAEIEQIDTQDTAVSDAVTGSRQPGHQPHRSGRKLKLLYGALFLTLLIAAIGVRMLFPGSGDNVESIAVLPLKNLSNDPDQEYFVEGMQDALITRLARITELRVISRTSTMRYEETDKSIPEIARELNVDAVIEGSVLRTADQVRITAQLVLGSKDEHLWAKSYDRDLDHVPSLINEISMAIANEIEVTVKQDGVERRPHRETVNIEVHELILKGRHSFERYRFDQSLAYFQQAAELDAEFAPAQAGVAGSHLLKGFLGWTPDSDQIPRAREAALKAIALDSNSAGGYSSLGLIQLYFDWDWESAKINLLKALELNPNDALTRHAYADYLMVMGDLEGSLNQLEIGRLYDPLSPMTASVLNFHRVLTRQYDATIEEGREAVARNPDQMAELPHFHEALWLKGMQEEAYAAYKMTWGRDKELLQAMESGYSESGYTGAIHGLAETLAGRDEDFYGYVTLAKLYVRAGDLDQALAWLETAYQYRQPQILHINAMPAFDELRSRPEFQDLLRQIGFPEATLAKSH